MAVGRSKYTQTKSSTFPSIKLVTVWVLITLPGAIAEVSWFRWICPTDPPPSLCSCGVSADDFHCSLGNSDMDDTVNCSEVTVQPSVVSIRCYDATIECVEIVMDSVFAAFSPLDHLEIDRCRLANFENINRTKSTISYRSDVHWSREVGGTVAISTSFNVPGLRNNITHVPCVLTQLVFRQIQLFRLPIHLIMHCPLLKHLELNDNEFFMIETVDFAVLTKLKYLQTLVLNNNSVHSFGSMIDRFALDGIQDILTSRFNTWVRGNRFALPNETTKRLLRFGDQFSGWSNKSRPLSYDYLFGTVDRQNISIDFSIGEFPLQTLSFSHNRFRSIPKEFFGLTGLKKLNMDYNLLNNIFDLNKNYYFYAFRDSLEDLSLRYNKINYIHSASFRYLKSLRHLDLSHNCITNIYNIESHSLSRIVTFNLSFNELKELSLDSQHNSLWRLDLSNNRLSSIDHYLTKSLSSVKKLLLANNDIHSFEISTVRNMTKLQYIDLRNNTFTYLPALAFQTSRRYTKADRVELDIRDNIQPWQCDCTSVFSASWSEVFFDKDSYRYPSIRVDPSKKCYGLLSYNSTLRRPTEGDIFLCYNLGSKCTQNCSCCRLFYNMKYCDCRWTCRQGCLCSERYFHLDRTINCSSRNISIIRTLGDAAKSVYLDGNMIYYLTEKVFTLDFKDLTYLFLNSSRISWIGEFTFYHLINLYVVFLNNNSLTHISDGLFARQSNLHSIYLQGNQMTELSFTPFANLTSLRYLDISNNPVTCNCQGMLNFVLATKRATEEGTMNIELPANCSMSASFASQTGLHVHQLSLNKLEGVCRILKQREEENWTVKRRRIELGVVLGLTFFLLTICTSLVFYYKHRIRAFADKQLTSQLARCLVGRLLHLPAYHERPFDVGFLVHECQSQHYFEIRRQLRSTKRRVLRIFRIAQHMPGAMRLSQTKSLIEQMATCVLLLSTDMLNDALFMQEMHLILSWNMKRQGAALEVLVILLNKNIKEHQEWSNLSLLLSGYATLVWGSHFFWERLLASLPPPMRARHSSSDSEEARPLIEESAIREETQLCVISHENQVGSHVRQLFDRFRQQLHVCHVRHRRLFGDLHSQCSEEMSLDTVVGLSTQVVMVLSLELLDDAWIREEVVPSLMTRLSLLPYTGSVILLDIDSGFSQLCSRPSYSFIAELRDHRSSVCLRWHDVESNWRALGKHLLTDGREELDEAITSMDEMEYERLLMQAVCGLRGQDQGQSSHRIFEQNRARWANPK